MAGTKYACGKIITGATVKQCRNSSPGHDGDSFFLPITIGCSLAAQAHYPGGDSHMKGVGMLDFSLSAVNFGFWSHLGCSEQNATVFSREGLV